MGQGKLAEAEGLLRTAVSQDPDDKQAQYHLGRSISRQKRYDEAYEVYGTVHDLGPKTTWAYFALRERSTHLVFRQREGEKAVQLTEEVWELTRRPDEAGNLMYLYSTTGQCRRPSKSTEWSRDIAITRECTLPSGSAI